MAKKSSWVLVSLVSGMHRGQPDTLALAIPGHGPGDIAHGQLVFLQPAGHGLDGGRVVGRVGDGIIPGGRKTKIIGRQATRLKMPMTTIAHSGKGSAHLVEQQIEETHPVDQHQRRQEHQQVLGVKLGGFLGELGSAQRLREDQHQAAPHQEVAQPRDGGVAKADQQPDQEERRDPTAAQPGQFTRHDLAQVGVELEPESLR